MISKKIKILDRVYNNPISCLAIYSSPVAKILDGNIDMILVGDSLGSTLYGMKNTRSVTLEMMKNHGFAVIKDIKKSITIIDMPYKSYNNKNQALKNAKALLKYTKAKLIKLEINERKLPIVKHLTQKNINVISHIGVTPQSYSNFNKIKIIGKSKKECEKYLKLALLSEVYGAKGLLLEGITRNLAKLITKSVSIPTIGIGASKFCDGQVLVFDDLINLSNNEYKPKFIKTYMNFNKLSKDAVRKFHNEVKNKKFPSKKFSY